MSLRSLISVLFLSAAALSPQIAHAQYGLSSSSNSNALGVISRGMYMPVSDPESDSHTGTIGPVSSNTNSYAGDLYEQGSGIASGAANYGSLQVAAGGGGEGGSGNGSNTSRWFDTVTITSTTLPLGSPVTLLATASYSGKLTGRVYSGLGSYPGSADGQASVTFKSNISGFSLPYATSLDVPSPNGYFSFQIFNSLPISQTLQQTVTTYVGAMLPLDSEIDFLAGGFGSGFKVSGGGSGNVSSIFDVQSQTAGVTLVRASGFVSVPEPSAFAAVLLGAGMFGMGLRLRRRS